jgi:Yip1 domain
MSIVTRAINMITNPKAEWDVIANEPASVGGLFTGYAMILALLPAIGSLVFLGLLGMGAGALPGMTMGIGLVGGMAVVGYVIGLALLWIMSFIINAITPSFNGKQDMTQATKLMVYAATPTWLAGLLGGIPIVGALLGLAAIAYVVYLIYLGVGPVLQIPQDKVAGMTVVSVLIYIVLWFVLTIVISGIVIATLFSSGMMAGAMAGA